MKLRFKKVYKVITNCLIPTPIVYVFNKRINFVFECILINLVIMLSII